jgi:hypothetical protein
MSMVQFLGERAAVEVLRDARSLHESGALRAAGMSRGRGEWSDPTSRGDELAWLTSQDLGRFPALEGLLARMEALGGEVMELDRTGGQVLRLERGRKSVQLAYYRYGHPLRSRELPWLMNHGASQWGGQALCQAQGRVLRDAGASLPLPDPDLLPQRRLGGGPWGQAPAAPRGSVGASVVWEGVRSKPGRSWLNGDDAPLSDRSRPWGRWQARLGRGAAFGPAARVSEVSTCLPSA